MTSRKTPVSRQVRVLRMPAKIVFAMPTPPPAIIGYVVRYEHGGPEGGLSLPLSYTKDYGHSALLLGDTGTIFPDFDEARQAVEKSVKYQQIYHCQWNTLYGDYLIDPVVAA